MDSSTGNPTSEEYHYAFDFAGRLRQAAFAQTPSGSPTSGSYYYASDMKAATRARTFYDYDSGGRTKGVYNWWDTLGSGGYTSSPIRANECVYEASGLNRGLKTQNKFYNVAGGAWNLQRTEGYGYDANLDYLTSANYGDGLGNATPSWTYDAAGNRASDSTNSGTWTYDSLNRMTASPGLSYTNDILGNRLTKGTMSHAWDDLNRMSGFATSTDCTTYAYRADGLRVSKLEHAGSAFGKSTRYRYDGQMGTEDVELNSSSAMTAITRYALGARGADAISRTTSSGTVVSYPLYDAHGNGIGQLSKSGSSWSVADERTYDAWGQVRSGGTTGDQKGRYCASIGHKQDDESGLVYMRARYYEPGTGKFISEDNQIQGLNQFSYCKNNPVTFADENGNYCWNIVEMLNAAMHLMEGQYGFGIQDKVFKLRKMANLMFKMANFLKSLGSDLIEDAAAKDEASAVMGDGSSCQKAIDDCERGAGAMQFGQASAALIAGKMIEIMIEILKSGDIDWLDR